MTIRKAKHTVVSVELSCPYCDETITAPNGSLYWTVLEIDQRAKNGNGVNCPECGKLVGVA